jgi:hypothetical protein
MANKSQKLLALTIAGQAFAGRSMRVLDLANAVSDEDLDSALKVFAAMRRQADSEANDPQNQEFTREYGRVAHDLTRALGIANL